jgi:hypothetical protein
MTSDAKPGTRVRIALVEIPPYGDIIGQARGNHNLLFGRLIGNREWLCETPLLLQLEEGYVIGIKQIPLGSLDVEAVVTMAGTRG